MATIVPEIKTEPDRMEILWEECATGDTLSPVKLKDAPAMVACVHAFGTFNSTTVKMLGSNNDAATFIALPDLSGTEIALTANGLKDFSTACLYLKPEVADGTSDDVDVKVVIRL